MNPDGSDARVLRQPAIRSMDWARREPLWTVWRDMLGDNLVPDYMTSVQDGAFYGWPYYYFGEHRDERVEIPANVRLQAPLAPDYALGAHTASLGLMFYRGEALPERYRGGAFIGQHGSWNRSVRVGYKVVFVPFADGRPSGDAQDFLTGFLSGGRRRAAPSALQWIAPARCWWPTMSETSSGASRPTRPDRRAARPYGAPASSPACALSNKRRRLPVAGAAPLQRFSQRQTRRCDGVPCAKRISVSLRRATASLAPSPVQPRPTPER